MSTSGPVRRATAVKKLGLGLLLGLWAWQGALAAGEVKAISSMYEIQAEAYRFVRLYREIAAGPAAQALAGKLRTQIKNCTNELFLNVHEAKPGLTSAGLQRQYQRLEDAIADYVSEGVTSVGDKSLSGLRGKQAGLLQLTDEVLQQLNPKVPAPTLRGLGSLGTAKVDVERLAYDYEFCQKNCSQLLPAETAAIDKDLEAMRATLGKAFSGTSYELAKNQMVFLPMAVDSRLKSSSTDLAQGNLIVTTTHLWELIDQALDAYVEAPAAGR